MSSEQISDKPLPPKKLRCPHCGEEIEPTAEMCWLCREKFSVQAGSPRVRHAQPAARAGDNVAWMINGLVVITICGALAFEAPGVLILLVILATPALVRTVIVHVAPDPDRPGGVMSVAATFLGALGVATLVGIASFIAFFATCFVVCLGGLELSQKPWGGDWLLPVSVGAGLVPGLAVAILLFRLFWVKKG